MKPLQIEFINRPNPDRLFKAWANIECEKLGVKISGELDEEKEFDGKTAMAVPA